MATFLMNLFLGFLPDVLYTYFYIKEIKQLKEKKILFFVLLFIAYFVCITQIRYQLVLYLILDVTIYLIMKQFYKSNITDFFLVIVLDLYMFVSSIACYFLIPNYIVAMIVYRIVLFLPLIFKKKLVKTYNEYCKLWNRHEDKKKIKSITIRNIVLVLLHLTILILHLAIVYIMSM